MNPETDRVAMMARTKWLLVVALLVAGAIAAMWALAVGRRADRDTATRQDGGNASAMSGMNMISSGSVQLTADQMRQVGITFGTVGQRTLENEIRAAGVVSVDETRVAQVAPKFAGYVERLHTDFTGKAVRRGDPLLAIYSPELLAAQEELLLAQRLRQSAETSAVPGVPGNTIDLMGAAKRRLRLLDVPEVQIEEIIANGRPQRTVTLYAPVSGVVLEKNVVRGQAVQAGERLYTIADLSVVWVEAELREADAVREGAAADVELAAYPGRPFKGRVAYVYPTLQEESRTLRARVAVANSAGALKPGMYATVRFTTPVREALTVPRSAVVRTGERDIVFVDMGGGSIMPHEVEVGRMASDLVEVLSGVERGQRVVTSAQFLIDSESNLAEVMRSMIGQMGRR